MGRRVKFHWSRPDLPAFCHIMEFIARSPSTSVSWNHLQGHSQVSVGCRAMMTEFFTLMTSTEARHTSIRQQAYISMQ